MSKSETPPKAVIFGCSGPVLTEEEKRFFRDNNPLGFILFGRNVADPDQVRALVADLRGTVGRAAPVLIDQEGGRVQRLGPPHWRKAPPAAAFASVAARWREQGVAAARLNARLLAEELRDLGIDVDCAPVIDVPVEGAHDIIGDRALGHDPAMTALLGRAICDGLLDGGVLPVIKHIPGHGRALADSHLELPVVKTSAKELEETDFVPFRSLADEAWAMTAHVVYSSYDPIRPATLSPTVVRGVIRGAIGFKGLLLTDDLSMKALSGSFSDRTRQAFFAGCDVALHCNGDPAEMAAVAAATPPLSDRSLERLARGEARRRRPSSLNVAEAYRTLDDWLA
ncbi:MAG: beta-N-acetylhexosaminidase [Alphaproteobacteria bacterium]|nr:beta-N-acetylhexosaminidase [Alphaproteobacteria bacterium]MBF0130233.1 beta-N-acetylhexosaminidase [Alphaproteobacteria bacterium]